VSPKRSFGAKRRKKPFYKTPLKTSFSAKRHEKTFYTIPRDRILPPEATIAYINIILKQKAQHPPLLQSL
jgi:hypothetical protein